MRAGRKDKLVTIQRLSETANAYGEMIGAWSAYTTAWASIDPLSGREYVQSKQVNAELTHKITINNISGITSKMRVVYSGRVFKILSVINLHERDKEIEIMCAEDV